MKRLSLSSLLVVGLLAFLAATLLVPACALYRRNQTLSDVWHIQRVLLSFKEKHGGLPEETQPSGIVTAIAEWRGPAKITLTEFHRDRSGSFVDPWKTPYRITTAGTNIAVLSAGPDRKFGTPDDIVAP